MSLRCLLYQGRRRLTYRRKNSPNRFRCWRTTTRCTLSHNYVRLCFLSQLFRTFIKDNKFPTSDQDLRRALWRHNKDNTQRLLLLPGVLSIDSSPSLMQPWRTHQLSHSWNLLQDIHGRLDSKLDFTLDYDWTRRQYSLKTFRFVSVTFPFVRSLEHQTPERRSSCRSTSSLREVSQERENHLYKDR